MNKSNIDVVWGKAGAEHWQKLLARMPSAHAYVAYQQHYAYGQIFEDLGASVLRAVIYQDQTPIGLVQIIVKKFVGAFTLATAIMGPVWLREDILQEDKNLAYYALRKSLPIHGLHAFLIMPPTAQDETAQALNLKQVISPYHTVLIDLQPDEEDIFIALQGKWRNRLRSAQKSALVVLPIGRKPEQYSWLLNKEDHQRRKIGYSALPTEFIPLFQQAVGKGAILALEAKQELETCGGMVFLIHGRTATYHIGWSSDAGKTLNVNNLLLWRAIQLLKKKGVTTLDLGGVTTDSGDGLARFKLGTGGRLLSQAGIFCLKPALW